MARKVYFSCHSIAFKSIILSLYIKISIFYRSPNYVLVYLGCNHLYDIPCVLRIELYTNHTFKKTVWITSHSKQSLFNRYIPNYLKSQCVYHLSKAFNALLSLLDFTFEHHGTNACLRSKASKYNRSLSLELFAIIVRSLSLMYAISCFITSSLIVKLVKIGYLSKKSLKTVKLYTSLFYCIVLKPSQRMYQDVLDQRPHYMS